MLTERLRQPVCRTSRPASAPSSSAQASGSSAPSQLRGRGWNAGGCSSWYLDAHETRARTDAQVAA